MQQGTYVLGMLAVALTSYLPQLQKAMPQIPHSRSVAENAGGTLSRRRPLDCLWRSERRFAIILANSIGATLSLAVPGFKIRDLNS
jgi:hypothetical protein